MHRTIFTTPVLNRFFYFVSLFYLRLAGWKVEGGLPQDAGHVIIAAPHTSNWDLLYALTMSFAMHFKVHWMGKDALFRPPFGSIMQWLGGLPIDRSKANSMVAQSIEVIKTHECLNLVVPPEGTRKKVHYGKTGFYYIAQGANVPVVLSYLDYKRKIGGIGPIIMPTGDIEADMEIIRTFYASVTGKHANDAGEAWISVKNWPCPPLEEVNSKTMESRLVKGLYFAGEVLDIDGDSGGYDLQAAGSTAALAAHAMKDV